MDLLLFGMQGSGKGTQGKFLVERYDLVNFVTGDELRRLAQEPSPLGQKIKSIIEAGHLVSNEVVMEIIENFMKNLPVGKNVLFDGIPRNKAQAKSFNDLMKRLNRHFLGVLIEISEDTALNRLSTRRLCKQCKTVYPAAYDKPMCSAPLADGTLCEGELVIRTDDANMDSIKNRLNAYGEETLPVIQQYEAESKIIRINGEQTIDQVNEDTCAKLDPLLKK
ncbi:MAG: nucleoside monophosphate kinase [Candidatus Gracilibacteria bacterium]